MSARFHEGQCVFAQGPRRDYLGIVKTVDENGLGLWLERFFWITRIPNVMKFLKNGCEGILYDDMCSHSKEHVIWIPLTQFEVQPFGHPLPASRTVK